MTAFRPRLDRRLLAPDRRAADVAAFADELRLRRATLEQASGGDPAQARVLRSFPVMAVLSPVMTVRGGEVSYPGDPMCLYAALGVAVSSAADSLERGLVEGAPYNDLLPGWGALPDAEARRRPDEQAEPTPFASVFDPRVWDAESRGRLTERLRRTRPSAVLISSVSAGFRYAIEIAALVRRHAPQALVVLGGRHADETVAFDRRSGEVRTTWSSPPAGIRDGRVPPVFDVVVSGQGAHALDAVLRALALALPWADGRPDTRMVVDRLVALGASGLEIAGAGAISVVLPDGDLVALPFDGPPARMRDQPSPYRAFPIRARFSVFSEEEEPAEPPLTAHMMTADTCPFRCTFCSEGRGVSRAPARFGRGEEEDVVDRVCELVHYGAAAVYFDDPVFWGGSFSSMTAFCTALARVRAAAVDAPTAHDRWIGTPADRERLRRLQWGAQLTVDLVAAPTARARDRAATALAAAASAGCTYIYIGIESMADAVMANVHKNQVTNRQTRWGAKVREALEIVREAGIRVGSSVLFGLEGETHETIEQTVEEVGQLIDAGLLTLASPNILTYHPGTAIAHEHVGERLDYHSPVPNRAPYTFFEEAFPGLVSRALDEEAIWTIHELADRRWGVHRNRDGQDSATVVAAS